MSPSLHFISDMFVTSSVIPVFTLVCSALTLRKTLERNVSCSLAARYLTFFSLVISVRLFDSKVTITQQLRGPFKYKYFTPHICHVTALALYQKWLSRNDSNCLECALLWLLKQWTTQCWLPMWDNNTNKLYLKSWQ